MLAGPRLRQVALVASNCDEVADQLQRTFGWGDPFHDPGVAVFGLTNAVFAVGDTFVEVVAPRQPDTTAGRYLRRRGGDGGYMAIFQLPELTPARQRLPGMGVRVVWTSDHSDMAGTHLHPKDVPGAIVSLDWADPPESWRWAGPAWTGGAPEHPQAEHPEAEHSEAEHSEAEHSEAEHSEAEHSEAEHSEGGLAGLAIEVDNPARTAERWAAVLGLSASPDPEAALVDLTAARQRLRFVPAGSGRGEGIIEIVIRDLAVAGPARIGGVAFVNEGDSSP